MTSTTNDISTPTAKLHLVDRNIIEIAFYDDTEINLDAAKEIVAAVKLLGNERKMLLLHVAGKFTTFTDEVQDYSVNEGAKYSKAEAYVTNSLAQRIIGNFYIKFKKPKVPTLLFTERSLALDWLRGFL